MAADRMYDQSVAPHGPNDWIEAHRRSVHWQTTSQDDETHHAVTSAEKALAKRFYALKAEFHRLARRHIAAMPKWMADEMHQHIRQLLRGSKTLRNQHAVVVALVFWALYTGRHAADMVALAAAEPKALKAGTATLRKAGLDQFPTDTSVTRLYLSRWVDSLFGHDDATRQRMHRGTTDLLSAISPRRENPRRLASAVIWLVYDTLARDHAQTPITQSSISQLSRCRPASICIASQVLQPLWKPSAAKQKQEQENTERIRKELLL